MPNAALVALTSPLLLGQAPAAAPVPLVSPSPSAATPFIETQRVLESGAADVLVVSWSLAEARTAQAQPAPEPPEEEDAPGDAAPENPAPENAGPDGDDNRIVVEGTYGPPRTDPMERVNEESYRITQQLDETFVEPIAYAYRDGLPGPLRDGLGNAVNNLREPNNALNFLLQGKIGKMFETIGRFAINSTIGIGGLIDVAEKPGINLPFRRNGFANTMGFYGVGPGPYLYLPLTGATSARDLPGSFLDQLLLPVAVGKPFNRPEFTVPFYLVANLEDRVEVDEELKRIDQTINPYAARRDTYLYRRAKTIAELRGKEPPEPPLILEEVEGTGDFADPPVSDTPPEPDQTDNPPEPAVAVIITRPR